MTDTALARLPYLIDLTVNVHHHTQTENYNAYVRWRGSPINGFRGMGSTPDIALKIAVESVLFYLKKEKSVAKSKPAFVPEPEPNHFEVDSLFE